MREDIKIKARPEDEIINAVIEREWSMFDKVQNIGGCRASCQDDEWTFYANRYSQFSALSQETVFSYYNDLTRAIEDGRNVITEKYAYMMEFTDPEYYHRELEASLPAVPAENMELVQQSLKYSSGRRRLSERDFHILPDKAESLTMTKAHSLRLKYTALENLKRIHTIR